MGLANHSFRNGDAVQVGGLKTSDAIQIAVAGTGERIDENKSRIVEIHNTSSSDCYFKIQVETAASGVPSAGDGVGFIAAKNCTRPFILPADGYITASQIVVVVPLDIETATS